MIVRIIMLSTCLDDLVLDITRPGDKDAEEALQAIHKSASATANKMA